MVSNSIFPNLRNYQQTSHATPAYNCVAWAAEDTQRFWWPNPSPPYYWPPGMPREATEARFVEVFRTLGYEPCSDGSLEVGWQKVVIYTDVFGAPTHMARQLNTGLWTSKLG